MTNSGLGEQGIWRYGWAGAQRVKSAGLVLGWTGQVGDLVLSVALGFDDENNGLVGCDMRKADSVLFAC